MLIVLDEFLYTNTTQISRLGPQLKIHSKDLCISLLVSLCENCEIIFFYQNLTERRVLKRVEPLEVGTYKTVYIKLVI